MTGVVRPNSDDQKKPVLWIVNHYSHLPSETSGLTRHFDFSKYLQKLGWDVVIVAAGTRHPTGNARISAWGRSRVQEVDGIKNVWIPTTVYRKNGVDRILNMLLFGVRTMFSSRLNQMPRPDIVIGSTPHPLAAFAGWFIARRKRVPFVYEVRDLWPRALIEMERLKPGSLMAKAMYRLEKFLVTRASLVISLWEQFDWYFEERGLKVRAIKWISNGFDETRFSNQSYKKEKGNPFNFVYFGAHGNANDLEVAIRAMTVLKGRPEGEKITLDLYGDGPLKPQLQLLANESNLTNVRFHKPVAKSKVAELGKNADAFLLTLKPLSIFRYGFSPNKLFEYMALKRPVLFCCNAFPNLVYRQSAGFVCKPGDPDALANSMMEMASTSQKKLQQMAQNGHVHAADNFTISSLAAKYDLELRKLLTYQNN